MNPLTSFEPHSIEFIKLCLNPIAISIYILVINGVTPSCEFYSIFNKDYREPRILQAISKYPLSE